MPKKKIYDGKKLFQAWCGWGAAASNPRLLEFSKTEFGIASQMGPHYAMWTWAFNNPEESFEMYKEWWFDNYPEKDPLEFNDYLIILRDKGTNSNIAGKRKLERFCARYGLDMDFRVRPGDVVQVTRKDHALFQNLLTVDNVEGDSAEAYIINPDGSSTHHQLKIKEFGVIGKSII